jgi:hypothetical protein
MAIAAEPKKSMYEGMYGQVSDNIDVQRVQQLARQIKIDGKAIRELRERTGMSFSRERPRVEGTAWKKLQRDQKERYLRDAWISYSKSLESGMKKLRLVLEDPDRSRNVHHLAFIAEQCPHKAFVPAYRAIAVNSDEGDGLRIAALSNLRKIPHEGLIPFLIEQLSDQVIKYEAKILLYRYTELPEDLGANEMERLSVKERKARWREWWKQHKDEWEFPVGRHVDM